VELYLFLCLGHFDDAAGLPSISQRATGLVLEWFNSLQAKDLGLVMTTLYHIWLSRNDTRDEPMIEDLERTARRVLAITEEWGKLREPSPNRAPKEVEHWCHLNWAGLKQTLMELFQPRMVRGAGE
jgi:hypothetical protein